MLLQGSVLSGFSPVCSAQLCFLSGRVRPVSLSCVDFCPPPLATQQEGYISKKKRIKQTQIWVQDNCSYVLALKLYIVLTSKIKEEVGSLFLTMKRLTFCG